MDRSPFIRFVNAVCARGGSGFMRNFPYFFDLPQPVSLICPGPRRCVGAVVREAGIRAPMEILLERESVLAFGAAGWARRWSGGVAARGGRGRQDHGDRPVY